MDLPSYRSQRTLNEYLLTSDNCYSLYRYLSQIILQCYTLYYIILHFIYIIQKCMIFIILLIDNSKTTINFISLYFLPQTAVDG